LKRTFAAKGTGAIAISDIPTTPIPVPNNPDVTMVPPSSESHPSGPSQDATVVDPGLTQAQDSGFRALVQQEVEAVTIDDFDNDPFFDTPTCLTTYPLIPISELFDFSNKTWSAILTKHALHNFDEELALYELLDLDAAGEDDVDVELDETTEQTLIG